MGARPRVERRGGAGRTSARDRPVGRPRRVAGARRATSRRWSARARPRSANASEACGRRRAGDGHPGRGEIARRDGLRRAGLPATEPRRARRHAAQLAAALDDALAAGAREIVLDNTYLSRAWRNDVVATAASHGLAVRCIWLDTPLAQAQVNLVERLLERFGRLLAPPELKAAARKEPGVLTPTQQMRALRELEPPADDEGFASVERVPFARARREGLPGVFVAAAAAGRFRPEALDSTAPHLLFDWRPDGSTRRPRGSRGLDLGVRRDRRLPAPGRAADVLVPSAPPGPRRSSSRAAAASIPRARSWWARAAPIERSRPRSTRSTSTRPPSSNRRRRSSRRRRNT